MPEIPVKEALNKAYIKVRPERSAIELFKKNFIALLDGIKANPAETEEFLKNLVSDFLKKTWYENGHNINTSARFDLVIHNGKTTDTPIGVIIEAKRPGNKNEMVSYASLNVKAMHELLLYYLRNTVDQKNLELKHLIITNSIEWYIFDAHEFYQCFSRNKKLVDLYNDFKAGSLLERDNTFFYTQIAAPYIKEYEKQLHYTHFNISEYETIIRNSDKDADKKLISLYKLLSPPHLLKLSFANDSNSLNQNFYSELLYIMGLSEEKVSGKKVIVRNKPGERQEGSLIENTIFLLSDYNLTENELFEYALELTITWVNRILFLKLLESQQIQYQKGDLDFAFLNIAKVKNYSDLYTLFFKVLAIKPEERPANTKLRYSNVPYLNSSLFDMTSMEKTYFSISNLQDTEIDVFSGTVLKGADGKKLKKKINALEYIFEFLNAYDFSSEGSEEIQEENKTLINASVLGLIFEKINGYKDGSYFTPGFITTYICREVIRNVVVNKFNEVNGWNAKTLDDIFNKIEDIPEANKIINSITICDPAVGSGHFLVSALNEIIAIKSDLGILSDTRGRRLKGYKVEVVNDELMIFDETGDFYTYNYRNEESRRIQETIFQEKRRIIENCLFGVDINPNSVKICRLRLWIELLKNAYYTGQSNYTELETLPNIDINIKCGNSLISRFDIDIDLKEELKKLKYSVKDYQEAVYQYKNAESKAEKAKLDKLISEIKTNFRGEIEKHGKLNQRKSRLHAELASLSQQELFEVAKAEKIKKEKHINEIAEEISAIDNQIEEINSNKMYDNAFEWRFEFPEVLNDEGDFIGFDAVIGNPPYIPLEAISNNEKRFFRQKYEQVERKYETSILFILEGFSLLKKNHYLSFIAPATWQTGENYTKFREFILKNKGVELIINLPFDTFVDAYVDTSIYKFINSNTENYKIFNFNKTDKIKELDNLQFVTVPLAKINPPDYKIILNKNIFSTLEKYDNDNFIALGKITKSTQGLSGNQFPECNNAVDKRNRFPFLSKGNVYNYSLIIEATYITDLSDKQSLLQFYQAEQKLLIRRIINRQDRLSVAYCDKKLVFKKDINPFICIDSRFSVKFLLGIIASKLISYIYLNSSAVANKDDFRQTTLAELRKLPIPLADIKSKEQIITLVEAILKAKKSDPNTNTQILENKIDNIVYSLYQLSSDEIALIEEKYKSKEKTK
jgi:type II restriction/modification system DNA methylase subunit YeeA